MEISLNVFTLNCWGIPVVSKNRKERFEALTRYLLRSSHDIVCLQEVWSETDYLQFKQKLRDVLPYSHYFYSGVLGSGLCVFSKWVIQDVFFHQWALNGYVHKIHHGDWFGGKGVGLCRIKYNNYLINVYCTHLHAEYHQDDIYLAHRMLQAYSTAELVKLTSASADVCVLAGDLNTGPGELSFKLISQLPSLLDPFDLQCAHTNAAVRPAAGTCDNANNSYSDPKMAAKLPDGKRIDHILFRVDGDLECAHTNAAVRPPAGTCDNANNSYSDPKMTAKLPDGKRIDHILFRVDGDLEMAAKLPDGKRIDHILFRVDGDLEVYPFDLHNAAVRPAAGTCDNSNNSYSDPKMAAKLPDGKRIDHILFRVDGNLECAHTNAAVRPAAGTCDNSNNSYSDPKMAAKLPDGKRIDHILFRVDGDLEAKVLNFGNPLEDRVPDQPFSYSDHNAVMLELSLRPGNKRQPQLHNKEDYSATVTEAIKVCEEAVVNISKSKTVYLTLGGLLVMFLLGTVGFWPNSLLYDVTKLVLSGLCFYSLVMGSLWNRIEMNSLKAGLTALRNVNASIDHSGDTH
ncbi:endonuclease/Exonuclease/phosphatase family domain-containing protein [Phthorimaea operculella]|nr:endonuclease/Exonuclease/phosphatase family domain-containing protein [Phthorimaea operculella]